MRKLFGLPKLESENFRVNNDYVFLYRILRKILMIENYLYDVKRGGTRPRKSHTDSLWKKVS